MKNPPGEFELIERIARRVPAGRGVIKGIGDDCAVIDTGAPEYTLLTCDMIVEGVDFVRGEKPGLIGRKALAISLSDIAACGGIPRYALVSLGLPKGFPARSVEAFYDGMGRLAKEFGVGIVGGDISRAPVLTIDLSLYGSVEKRKLVLRSGAREDDIIFVTGSFGGSIRGKHLRFVPRVREARFLVDHFRPGAMIDCSDGFAADLSHILDASRKGCVVFEHLIPQSKASSGIGDALGSGEDFELIFTLDRVQAGRLIRSRRFGFLPVGSIVPSVAGRRIIGADGKGRILEAKGYRHF